MTLNHATMTTAINTLPRTEFGMPVLSDMDTNSEWWAMHPEANETPVQIISGTLNYDASLAGVFDVTLPEGIREPDLYDEGQAVWLSSDAVVRVDLDMVRLLPHALSQTERYTHEVTAMSRTWTRLHPNRYGIEVDSFFDHGRGIEAHAAQDAWTLAEKAVRA